MTRFSRRTLAKSGMTFAAAGSMLPAGATLMAAQDGGAPILGFGINAGDIQTLDPHFASGGPDRAIVDMVFNGLLRFIPGDSSSFEPDLATDFPTATDNENGSQTWSFTLQSGVMTHPVDGAESYELTLDDVLFSFEKAANAETSAFAGDYTGWEFAIGDDDTFQVTVPIPLSETLFYPKVSNYSGGYIIPQQAYEAVGTDGFISHPVGTGPFALDSYTPQTELNLAPFAEFFRGEPQLGGINCRFLADPTSRELALQTGDVQLINGLPESSWVERMDAMDGIRAEVFGVGEVIWVNLDVNHEILQDPLVREAIFLAINREEHAALFGDPISAPIYSVTGDESVPGSLSREEAEAAGVTLEQDIERAKELLAEAGYADGFELDLITSEMVDYRRNYEVLIEELRQIGITVNLEVVQHASMHELIREGRNAIVIYVGFRPDASVYLTQFFSSGGGVTNFSNFTVDDLLEESLLETDADRQIELWKEANIEIAANFAGMGLMYKNQVFAMVDGLELGHELVSQIQYYPGINEVTTLSES